MGALVLECSTYHGIQEVGVVEVLVDNKGFECLEEQAAQIDELSRAAWPLVLSIWPVLAVAAAVVEFKDKEDLRAAGKSKSGSKLIEQ